MPHLFGCPCGQQFAVLPQTLGQKVRCPHCARVLHIPAPATPPPLTRAPSPARPAPRSWRLFLCITAFLVLSAGAGILLFQHFSTIPEDPPAPQARNDNKTPKRIEPRPDPGDTDK